MQKRVGLIQVIYNQMLEVDFELNITLMILVSILEPETIRVSELHFASR
ncbi:hypothetical protein PEDI_20650 [Persicobacter diffluens]|uniref:Uncharacterized protein n=1 Tax=Persicobacter diffluens TaxID=981 RepID=A0AAN5AM46_9BACT|nr:hypothetical protein PEDI_20650 [Persicobacter diffluens]